MNPMEREVLSWREWQVLQALVKTYVALGVPVGSRTLLDREILGISAATIRNTLAALEEKEYLHQPHTSAGRIPTDKGYRLYVEQCVDRDSALPEGEGAQLRQHLTDQLPEGGVDEILGQLAQVIGQVSNQLGLVMAPAFEQGIFQKVELVKLSEQRLLLVLTIHQGSVRSLVIEVGTRTSQRDLEILSAQINQRLQGLTMAQIRASMRERMASLETGDPQLLRVISEEIEGLHRAGPGDLHVAGTRNICLQPEFRDPQRMAELIDLVEKKAVLAQMLQRRQGMVVTIGREHEALEMQLCSVVTASYEVDGALGVIGVIGPTRMPYARVVALVNYMACRAAEFVG
ncbi:MAG: heat-inducible transcription repressor HrcA [Candidatus Latescibacteria bacterium]|nr:heat-inducible transcription repressor HrcA [Candidatus Latescibacterota bacterium]